jgi:hypothetical protein
MDAMKPTPAICFAADVKKPRQMEKARLLNILNEYQQTINKRFDQDLLVPFTRTSVL